MSVVLSEHLPLLAGAPDGIQKLRGLILELAVRGKLVPQDPNDEPASELLKRIEKERERLEVEGVCKKSKATPSVDENEQPFALPGSWKWVRLSELLERLSNGYTGAQSKSPTLFPLTRIETISKSEVNFAKVGYCSEISPNEIEKYRLKVGDILLSHINSDMHVGKTALYSEDRLLIHGVNLLLLRPFQLVSQRYVDLAINSCRLTGYFLRIAQHAIGQSSINQAKLSLVPISLPPLAEQHRIVAKVDELMALCDRLEAEQTDATSAHTKLVETLLGTLTQSRDALELAANWQRLSQHFDTLFSTEPSLDALKQTILQLAVMGKLVPQDAKDEPARELLKRIAKERTRLEAEGVCKKLKGAPVVGEGEMSFTPPVTWVAVRLSRIVSTLGDGLHGTPEYESGTPYFFINGNNLINGKIVIKSSTKSVSSSQHKKHQKPLCDSTILVSINGSLGRIAYYNDEQVILGKSACFFNLLPFTSKDFVRLILESEYFISYAFKNATGSTIKNLGLKAMNDFPVPLPPLAEQHRIVAKVNELMALCDRLKADLAESRTRQARLSTTLIDAALKAA